MGVITCPVPMNPTGDVTYTHKKFKRPASEAIDGNADLQQKHPPAPLQLSQPREAHGQQQSAWKSEKAEVAEARPTSLILSQPLPLNGHYPAQLLNYQPTSNASGQLPSAEGNDLKRKNSGSVGGKYKCEYCGVGCPKPSVLDKHIRTHTNERPFSCDHCRIAFKTKSNYLKHTKSRAHVLKCDNVVIDGGEGLLESSEYIDVERGDSPRCPTLEGNGIPPQVQQQPADLSIPRPLPSKDPSHDSSVFVASATPKSQQQDSAIKDRGKSLYKPKFRAQYSLQEENISKGDTPPPPPPSLPRRPPPAPPLGHQVPLSHDNLQADFNTSNSVTYHHTHSASNPNNHSSLPSRHSVSPAQFPKQCLSPLDIRAAASASKKEELPLSGQRSSGVVPAASANSLWKGMKSPSPELLGQHITKLIVENQAIVETHNPLWSRRYRRQSSLGSSSSESDGSGSNKSRRGSLVDNPNKNVKPPSAAGPSVSYTSPHTHSRERSHSLTNEALMIEPRSSYSPSLPNPHLPLAQPPATLISASKPSISSHGPTTSYSQSDPTFATSQMVLQDMEPLEGSRKRSIIESPGVLRDSQKSRMHLKNSEGSVIKNLLLTARAGITSVFDQNLERLEQSRLPVQNTAVPAEVGLYASRPRCPSPENLEIPMRHYSGHRQGGSGSERGTPDSIKSSDGGRWSGEQDVALDLQKKDRSDIYDHERSSSRGSSISVGEPSLRRGSDEDIRYQVDMSPRLYGNGPSLPDGASPPTKKRKLSDPEAAMHEKNVFLSPIFSPKGQVVGKIDSSMKTIDEIGKHKPGSRHFFGGEVQICDGKNYKTMKIDPSQQPSPSLDICIPPQQLGGGITRSEVSVPTSVVVTIAKSGLNSGGTMVQVEGQMSTSSTKTVPSLVNSMQVSENPSPVVSRPIHHPSKVKPIPHPPVYPPDASHFPFTPFAQYAPFIPVPNLTIDGIPVPKPFAMNPPPKSSNQLFQGTATHSQKQSAPQSPLVHSRVSSLTLPQGTSIKGVTAGSHLSGSRGMSLHNSPSMSLHGGTHISPSMSLHGGTHISPSMSLHGGTHISPSMSLHGGTHSSPSMSLHGGAPTMSVREKEQLKKASYPALIPVGNEKVPYVPGIPGPYSQAGSVVQPHFQSVPKSPLAVFTPPVPASSLPPTTSKGHLSSVLSPVPVLRNEVKEVNLSLPPKLREASKEPPKMHARDSNHHGDSAAHTPKVVSHVPSKDMLGQIDKPMVMGGQVKPMDMKPGNPEIKIHPVMSSPLGQQGKESKKNPLSIETTELENSRKSSTPSKEFPFPPKRPDSLALKPQPFVPKSDSLIGTTLVSPDTPRPKKSCVQLLLDGSAYTYLGHKVSTKSYFCCIHRQQPMYAPQSTDPKLSMYSNWQIRKPTEENPFDLTPYQSLGLYESRKYNHDYTIAREKEVNLIQTHSSYWKYKEENEKNKEKEKGNDNSKVKADDQSPKVGSPTKMKSSEEKSPSESCGSSVKREPDDQSDDSSSKTDEAAGPADGSAKRIKIFEGGFKSTEEYTYVRGRGRGRYVCGACGIRCKKPSMLKKHIRTHTDLRPYACSHCSFSFKTKGNLTKHLRSKAHYKRCFEMGVVPVPTVVDESHVNEEALALQGKMEQERIDDEDDDDDDDDEDEDDDEEIEDEEEDEEAMDEDQFEDAEDSKEEDEPKHMTEKENQHVKEMMETRTVMEPRTVATCPTTSASVSRAGVLVMVPGASNSTGSDNPVTSEGKESNKSSSSSAAESSSRDSPMDLTVKKTSPSPSPSSSSSSLAADKISPLKKHSVPARPNFLPIMSKSTVADLQSPGGKLVSPGTPSTPIREHPSEILSPVTESSALLKSIYNTTLRISNVNSGEMPNIVPDPTKENGCNSSMLQAYLKERAVLDTTFKRQQYKSSSSETSPDSPQGNNSLHPAIERANSSANNKPSEPSRKSEEEPKSKAKLIIEDGKKDKKDATSQSSSAEQRTSSTSHSSASQGVVSRMPTPPANLTVMYCVGGDSKTAFLVPSGVVPSAANRLGNDDGKCRCSKCHKEFNKLSQLSIHMNIHFMERPYRCDSCSVSFRTNGHLQKHKRSISHYNKVNMNMTFGMASSDNPRPFKCHDCKIAFRIHGHLAKHLRSKMHIMKLECLGKLPFGTYAEIERSGANLNEIDTTDCDNSLESLQSMATRLYEKEPSKLAAWQNQKERTHHRVRTVSNSSNNSDDYPLQDEQDDPLSGCGNDEDTEGDDDEDMPGRINIPVMGPSSSESPSPQSNNLQTIEIGSQQLTQPLAHPFTCRLCEAKFTSQNQLVIHNQQNCVVKSS